MSQNENNKRKIRLFRVIIWILGIWIATLAVLETALSSTMLTNSVNRIAGKYIDGDISFGDVSISVMRRFPNICLNLDDFSITYPADRFDASEAASVQGALMYQGSGVQADTLASFDRFYAKISIFHLLADRLRIPDIELYGPRIFAHSYEDGRANWDIFKLEADPDDTTKTAIPRISIGRIKLEENPYIIYTSSKDTIFAMIELSRARFDGRLATGKYSKNRIGLDLDSMFVAGRVASDTLAVGLDRLRIHEHDDHMDVDMQAKTLIATQTFGRLNIPVELGGTVHFPKDSVFAVGVHNFRAEVAAIPMEGEVDLRFLDGRTEVDGRLSVSECKAEDVLQKFVRNFIPEADRIRTDAVIGIDATCRGEYVHETGRLPVIRVDAVIPQSTVSHKDIGDDVSLALDASLASTRKGAFNVTVNNIDVSTTGLNISGYGSVMNLLSDDPSISVDGTFSASLDSLMRFIPESLDITAAGSMDAEISGTAKMSDLTLYTFSNSSLTGKAVSESIIVSMPDDSLYIEVQDLGLNLGPENVTSRRDSTQSFRLMGITGNIGKVDASYKGSLALKGDGISLSAKNSSSGSDTTSIGRLGGRFGANNLTLTDASGMSVDLDETQNGFQMMPQRNNHKIPVLTLTSTNKRITLVTDVNRAILTDASIKADAAMNSVERRQRSRSIRDSLTRHYPGVSRQTQALPDWLQEEDFRKQDIDIRLDQSLAKYFREWEMHGDIDVRTGIIMTPYFPLRNILRGMQISFTNDSIGIDSLKVMSGKSGIEAKGNLTGLRRALTGGSRGGSSRSTLKLNMAIRTDGMDANEILTAYKTGSQFDAESAKDKMADASNADFLQMVISDTVSVPEKNRLLVIPGNVNADITLNGKNIRYSDLNITRLDASLLMKERCVQITNTMATSNIGDVSFEGFYSTRSKQDIKAGFNFDFNDITAEKAISLMPEVDTIMPLLKSFAGKLNCTLAATASLDTNMNILTPTINGVLRISGDGLTISDSDMFTSLAKKLKFDNRKTGRINHMTVEGVIKDDVLEVFPFVLTLDRYTLALSGKQNLDMSYRYHASLIRSPMLIKVGVDIYGQDFDNMKFKIGRPKYKNEKVPVFTAVIDETRLNLAQSIKNIFEKGVEAAIQENERQEAILGHSKEIGYINAVDQETEELSEEEQMELDQATAETNNESTENQQDNE